MFNGEVAEVFTWTIEPVSFNNHKVIFAKPVASVDVMFIVKLPEMFEALAGVGETKSNAGAVASTVNVLRDVLTFPRVSVAVTFT
jgi:hypothetical protein